MIIYVTLFVGKTFKEPAESVLSSNISIGCSAPNGSLEASAPLEYELHTFRKAKLDPRRLVRIRAGFYNIQIDVFYIYLISSMRILESATNFEKCDTSESLLGFVMSQKRFNPHAGSELSAHKTLKANLIAANSNSSHKLRKELNRSFTV